ncbi:DUF6327 family protein [Flavobacterium sp. N1719]|uniref:DUF6327 family protein n=1 Tax=Flavobacterium sp. N1719 TaxID=2885633 RepID=UPI002221F95A|nr:DUF6327 family protein [Flavobacterium sp. N1719]
MATKKYRSYAEIDRDLEVLKVERELYYRKAALNIQNAKEAIFPTETASYVGWLYKNVFSGTIGTVLKIAFPYIIQWFINRKRGD